MSLDPQLRASWRDLMGILRPPADYSLEAAIGTTFGLGFDALVASLLATMGVDGEALIDDPLATVIAATRLQPRVRILVQAGTVSGAVTGIPSRLACLLDRMLISIKLESGLYHPKLWVVRFKPKQGAQAKQDFVRVLVGSRNLTASSAFEIGALLDGHIGSEVDELGSAVSRLLANNVRLGASHCERVEQLIKALRCTRLVKSDLGRDTTLIHWQGPRGKPHHRVLPGEAKRALVMSPFLSSTFVLDILKRTKELRIVSTVGAFNRLEAGPFAALVARAAEQQAPALYVVTEHPEQEDQGKIEGLHAKMVLLDDGASQNPVTFLGSANATAAGWGIGTTGNAEALLELRPGLGIDRILHDFVVDKKGKPKPWIQEFEAADRSQPSEEELLHDEVTRVLRDVASSAFWIAFSKERRTLTLGLTPGTTLPDLSARGHALTVECLPLALREKERPWVPLPSIMRGSFEFPDTELADATAFVVLRTTVNGAKISRVAIAHLKLSDELLDERDHAARKEIILQLSPEDVLGALILGLARTRRHSRPLARQGAASRDGGSARALEQVTLERTLQAVAQNPDLVRELRLVLLDDADPAFLQFRDDLELVLSAPAKRRT